MILAVVAVLLARESKALLVGESADRESVQSIRALVEADEAVERAPAPLTMQLGPEEVLLNLAVEFREGSPPARSSRRSGGSRTRSGEKHPEVRRIFIEVKPGPGPGRADGTAFANERDPRWTSARPPGTERSTP